MTPAVLLGTLAVLSGATLGGFCLARLFGGDLLARERLGWSMACGWLLLAAVSAGLMAAGLLPGPKKLAAALVVLLLASFVARRPGRAPSSTRRPQGAGVLAGVLLLLALSALALFAVEAARSGIGTPDFVAGWGLKARTIFLSHWIPRETALLYPLSLASVAAALRVWDERALALCDVFLALASVLVVSGFLTRRISRLAGATGGLLVALCAPLFATGILGTAEIPLALGLALAATALLDVLDRETGLACARLFLASLFCVATKTEGSLWIAVLMLTLFVRALRGYRLPRLAALVLVLPLGLAAWRVFATPASHTITFDTTRLQLGLLQIVGVDARRAWLTLLILGGLLLITRTGLGDLLATPLGLQAAAYAGACGLGLSASLAPADGNFARACWTLFPVVVLLVVPRAFESLEPHSAFRGPTRGPAPAALGVLILSAVLLPTALQGTLGEKRLAPSAPRPTFHGSIQPLLQERCQSCHHEGGIAPFSLTGFDDAKTHGAQIRRQVVSRNMPPWKAEDSCERFANDPSLSDAQIAEIVRWLDLGAPEGNPKDAPPPRTFSEGWELGTPDLVLQAPEFTPDFSKGDLYQCFAVPTNLDEDRWVAAVEVKPGNRTMVHHALLYVEEGVRSFDFDAEAPGPGYPCFGGPRAPVTDSFGEWAPGMQPHFFPEGVARFLPRKSRILMQIHYSALSGTIQPDRSEVGVYFAKAPATRRLLSNDVRADGPFVIPAGAPKHTLRGRLGPLRSRAELIAILPHMHLLGKTMRVDARLPDGTTRCLVDVRDWDLRWQRTYFYEKPVVLPAGTMLDLTATFDNSYANLHNPNRPPRNVYTGEHTTDEMCMALLFWTVDGKNPGEKEAFFRGEVCGVGPTPTPTPVSSVLSVTPPAFSPSEPRR